MYRKLLITVFFLCSTIFCAESEPKVNSFFIAGLTAEFEQSKRARHEASLGQRVNPFFIAGLTAEVKQDEKAQKMFEFVVLGQKTGVPPTVMYQKLSNAVELSESFIALSKLKRDRTSPIALSELQRDRTAPLSNQKSLILDKFFDVDSDTFYASSILVDLSASYVQTNGSVNKRKKKKYK